MAGLYGNRDQYFGIIGRRGRATAPSASRPVLVIRSTSLSSAIMGLDHVRDPDQLMYSGRHPNVFLHDYGTGDLAGLRRLGVSAGCLD